MNVQAAEIVLRFMDAQPRAEVGLPPARTDADDLAEALEYQEERLAEQRWCAYKLALTATCRAFSSIPKTKFDWQGTTAQMDVTILYIAELERRIARAEADEDFLHAFYRAEADEDLLRVFYRAPWAMEEDDYDRATELAIDRLGEDAADEEET